MRHRVLLSPQARVSWGGCLCSPFFPKSGQKFVSVPGVRLLAESLPAALCLCAWLTCGSAPQQLFPLRWSGAAGLPSPPESLAQQRRGEASLVTCTGAGDPELGTPRAKKTRSPSLAWRGPSVGLSLRVAGSKGSTHMPRFFAQQ